MDPSKKYVIVELNDGYKVEGILTDVDKTNFTIHISEATKYRTDEKGNNIQEQLDSPNQVISKSNIKEVKLVQYDQLSQQKQTPNQTLPVKPTQQIQQNFPQSGQFGSLPTTQLPKMNQQQIKYQKTDFFDSLGGISNREMVRETIRDNEKNKETFNLPDNYGGSGYQGNRGGGGGYNNRRGRGGRNRQNYNPNYNNYNQGGYNRNQGGYNSNQGGFNSNQGEFNSNQGEFNSTQGGFNSIQGGYRGGYQGGNSNFNQRRGGNKFEQGNRGGRGNRRGRGGNRNFGGNFGGSNFGGNFNTFNDDHDDKCEERGKSIYDL